MCVCVSYLAAYTAVKRISSPVLGTKILDGQLTDKYHEVQQRVDTKAKVVQDAKKRAEHLRHEAKELLRDAQNKLQRLAGAYASVCVYWMDVSSTEDYK